MYNHQSRIVAALFAQLSDSVLGIGKCRVDIWQVDAIRVILDSVPSENIAALVSPLVTALGSLVV